jgi:VIT1/CCC1 family predicted Fe2+/Mn2+ transporter
MGANDGIVSTASLIIGIAAAGSGHTEILLAGLAGLVAGAMSMAAGEYVSVSSQADIERADLDMERQALAEHHEAEIDELAEIYQDRGLEPELARTVAIQLMAHDALAAHARDEIGISEVAPARPIEAALSSGATFTVGAALPLLVAWLVTEGQTIAAVSVSSLIFLAALGALAARAGGASIAIGALRVTFWGALAMLLTALVGRAFGIVT